MRVPLTDGVGGGNHCAAAAAAAAEGAAVGSPRLPSSRRRRCRLNFSGFRAVIVVARVSPDFRRQIFRRSPVGHLTVRM